MARLNFLKIGNGNRQQKISSFGGKKSFWDIDSDQDDVTISSASSAVYESAHEIISEDEDSDAYLSFEDDKTTSTSETCKNEDHRSTRKTASYFTSLHGSEDDPIEILEDENDDDGDVEAEPIMPLKKRKEFATRFFKDLDCKAMNNQLMAGDRDIEIIWNNHLKSTAGRAVRKRFGQKDFKVSIELSSKVCDTEVRLKNTIAHEACHLALWLIDGETKNHHGIKFKKWGRKVMDSMGDDCIVVTRKHTYAIRYKYRWQCTGTNCNKVYGRHSASIDVNRHVCGKCKSLLRSLDDSKLLASKKARPATAYQMFVKEMYGKVKADCPINTPQTQIMREISGLWNKKKAEMAIGDENIAPINTLKNSLQQLEISS